MRKGREGEKNRGKTRGGGKKRLMKIVATTSLPAVDRPNNTARMTTAQMMTAGTPHACANMCLHAYLPYRLEQTELFLSVRLVANILILEEQLLEMVTHPAHPGTNITL